MALLNMSWKRAWCYASRLWSRPEGGDFSIKLEDQVLITEDGFENLTRYPFDAALMGAGRLAKSAWPKEKGAAEAAPLHTERQSALLARAAHQGPKRRQ